MTRPDADLLEARVAARRNDASDADVTIVRQQATYDPGAIDWHQQDASRGVEDTLRALEPVLAPLRRSSPAAPPSSDDG